MKLINKVKRYVGFCRAVERLFWARGVAQNGPFINCFRDLIVSTSSSNNCSCSDTFDTRGYITSSTQGGQGGGAPGGGVGDEAPWIAGVWGRSPHRGQGAKPPGKFLRKLDNFDAFSSTWGTRIYISSN